jgi:hypothetical protein
MRELTSSPCIERRLVKLVIVIAQFYMGGDEPTPDLGRERFRKVANDVYDMCLKSSEDAVRRRQYRSPLGR